MTSYLVECAYCGDAAELATPWGRFCSPKHRTYFHRDALIAQRKRLAADAEAALASGDIAELERIARSTADLLKA